jgi:hypothetical protein
MGNNLLNKDTDGKIIVTIRNRDNINGDMLKKVEGSESQQNSAPQA